VKLVGNEQIDDHRTPAVRWQIALAFLAFILIGANQGGVGIILPGLSIDYALNKATVGFLFIAGTSGFLIAGFSSGLILEKAGQRFFLSLGAAAFLLGVCAISLKPAYGLMLAAFSIVGFGAGIIGTGLNAYIARLPNSNPVLNYLHASFAAGAFVGPVVASSLLAVGVSWNTLYVVWLFIGLIVLAGFVLLYSGRDVAAEQDLETANNKNNLIAATFKARVVWFSALFLFIYTGAEVTVNNWGYTYLTEFRHQKIILSGEMVSGYWLGLMLGRLVLGKLSERISNRNLIQGCLIGVIASLCIVWVIPGSIPAAAGLFLAGFCLGPIFPTTIALMPEFLPDRIVTTAIGFLASFAAAGSALMPWMAGNLVQGFGLSTLMPFVMALGLADWGIWLLLERKPIREDIFPMT
jgi:fucose permease